MKSDESIGPSQQQPPATEQGCTENDSMCVGTNFYKCHKGSWAVIDCLKSNMPVCDDEFGCMYELED